MFESLILLVLIALFAFGYAVASGLGVLIYVGGVALGRRARRPSHGA